MGGTAPHTRVLGGERGGPHPIGNSHVIKGKVPHASPSFTFRAISSLLHPSIQANEQVLVDLLRDPKDFVSALDDRCSEPAPHVEGGEQQMEEARGAPTNVPWEAKDGASTTSRSYDDTFQLITHLFRDWAPEGREIR